MDSVVEQILVAAAVNPAPFDRVALRECIEAVRSCAHACLACADACLGEEMVEELTGCIRVLSDTADICEVTARVLLRRSGPDDSSTRALLAACWAACRRARAERACQALMSAVSAPQPTERLS